MPVRLAVSATVVTSSHPASAPATSERAPALGGDAERDGQRARAHEGERGRVLERARRAPAAAEVQRERLGGGDGGGEAGDRAAGRRDKQHAAVRPGPGHRRRGDDDRAQREDRGGVARRVARRADGPRRGERRDERQHGERHDDRVARGTAGRFRGDGHRGERREAGQRGDDPARVIGVSAAPGDGDRHGGEEWRPAPRRAARSSSVQPRCAFFRQACCVVPAAVSWPAAPPAARRSPGRWNRVRRSAPRWR